MEHRRENRLQNTHINDEGLAWPPIAVRNKKGDAVDCDWWQCEQTISKVGAGSSIQSEPWERREAPEVVVKSDTRGKEAEGNDEDDGDDWWESDKQEATESGVLEDTGEEEEEICFLGGVEKKIPWNTDKLVAPLLGSKGKTTQENEDMHRETEN